MSLIIYVAYLANIAVLWMEIYNCRYDNSLLPEFFCASLGHVNCIKRYSLKVQYYEELFVILHMKCLEDRDDGLMSI
jgi:hypothetical protein